MKKVTEEELTQIQKLRESLFDIITSIGELTLNKYVTETQLQIIEDDIKEQKNKFSEFQEKERVLFEQLQTKYGTGNIDMETGEVSE